MAERYYVYENWTNTFAKAHRGSCPYCNDGTGNQGRGSKTQSGQWHGDWPSMEDALRVAQSIANGHSNASVWTVGPCGYCG